ncbi:MAG: hypothetical protein K8R74_09660, partial [Bacteroidales bacterium]|nr:hypothetical protein [Bacteroidales bacterium]
GNLPENGTVHSIAQDHKNSNLLFAGTEFGIFFSVDMGKIWTQLKSGIPTNAVRDIAIQERENDLVLATFGRGFYILDDYTPLRELTPELLDTTAYIFPVKDALMYVQKRRGGYGSGSNVYIAKNPDFGATFTYYIKESPKTLKAERREKEKELIKNKERIPIPTIDELRAEKNEVKPHLIFTIRDEEGNEVRKMTADVKKGISRINWNLRYPGTRPVSIKDKKYDPLSMGGDGMYVLPGKYTVSIAQFVRGEITELAGPVEFIAKPLDNTTLPAEDRKELVAFQKKMSELYRIVSGAESLAEDQLDRIRHAKQAAQRTIGPTADLMSKIENVESQLDEILWKFNGQKPKASREENWPAVPSINERLRSIIWVHWRSTSAVTQSQKDVFDILKEEVPPVLDELKSIHNTTIPEIEKELDRMGAPWTPGRVPEWNID